MSGSRSRSRGPAATVVHATGRGGAGNIHYGSTLKPEVLDDEERRQHAHHEGMSVPPSLLSSPPILTQTHGQSLDRQRRRREPHRRPRTGRRARLAPPGRLRVIWTWRRGQHSHPFRIARTRRQGQFKGETRYRRDFRQDVDSSPLARHV